MARGKFHLVYENSMALLLFFFPAVQEQDLSRRPVLLVGLLRSNRRGWSPFSVFQRQTAPTRRVPPPQGSQGTQLSRHIRNRWGAVCTANYEGKRSDDKSRHGDNDMARVVKVESILRHSVPHTPRRSTVK